MLKQSLLTILFVLFANLVFSQNNNDKKEKSQLSLEQRLEGTYEIIIMDPKKQDVFTTDFLNIIEEKREENIDVVYDYSRYTRFVIYSKAKISSPGFIRNKTSK